MASSMAHMLRPTDWLACFAVAQIQLSLVERPRRALVGVSFGVSIPALVEAPAPKRSRRAGYAASPRWGRARAMGAACSRPQEGLPQGLLERIEELEHKAERQAKQLHSLQKGQDPAFTVAQYNILASYLGSNTQPWFMYGIDMPEDLRATIIVRAAHPLCARARSGEPTTWLTRPARALSRKSFTSGRPKGSWRIQGGPTTWKAS